MAAHLSLLPTEVDLVLYAGDGANFSISVTDADNQPIPIDGAVMAQIRKQRADTAVAADFTVDMTDALTGTLVLELPGTESAGLIDASGAKFSGFWDVQWTPVGSEPVTLLQGKVEVYADVTRP